MTLGRSSVLFGVATASTLLALGCSAPQSTQRVFNGQNTAGPYIAPEAYAAFAEGSYHEARGEWERAEQAYRLALAEDPESPGIRTRLGVLACRSNLEAALDEFETDDDSGGYAPAWAERAHCLQRHGRREEALDSARRAVTLDPGDARANLLIADLYLEQSLPEKSGAWLFAWLVRDPGASSHWRATYDRAQRLRDAPLAGLALAEGRHRAGVGVSDVSPIAAPGTPTTRGFTPPDVAAALRIGDLSKARETAGAHGLSTLDLALLAIANGRPELGLAQAELMLAADPRSGDAFVTALFASAVLGNVEKLEALLETKGVDKLPAAHFAELLTELLRWQVGEAAANQWRDAYQPASDAEVR